MKVIYEITVTVNDEIIATYEKYMREQHIPDLLQTGNFSSAFFTRSDKNRYRIQYHAHDQQALDEYLKNDATRLREDFAEHFPVGVEVSRENWEVLQFFKVKE